MSVDHIPWEIQQARSAVSKIQKYAKKYGIICAVFSIEDALEVVDSTYEESGKQLPVSAMDIAQQLLEDFEEPLTQESTDLMWQTIKDAAIRFSEKAEMDEFGNDDDR